MTAATPSWPLITIDLDQARDCRRRPHLSPHGLLPGHLIARVPQAHRSRNPLERKVAKRIIEALETSLVSTICAMATVSRCSPPLVQVKLAQKPSMRATFSRSGPRLREGERGIAPCRNRLRPWSDSEGGPTCCHLFFGV